MFDHIFENRDKKVTNLIKLSDYLGRSLRENVEIFSIDDSQDTVTFVTESGKILVGEYDFTSQIELTNIQVEDGELFEDNEKFDDYVNYKISDFVQNIYEEDFGDADSSFSKVLDLWESRVKFSAVKEKLYEKSQKFNGSNRIISTDEFQKLVEYAPQLASFLKKNTNISNIPEIRNMVRLSSTVSEAFSLPRLKIEDLKNRSYVIPAEVDQDVYEMICKHELVRKELVESKNNFDLVWLNNPKISRLSSMVYESDEAEVVRAMVEAICDVPYLALASKKQITQTILNNLELTESLKIKTRDIKAFSSLIFEYKKPVKTLFMSMLNEKYGISVQNLRDIPTFKSLLNTQVLIFEALSKLSPKSSIQKDVLSEAAKMIKGKNGVECIDVNDFLQIVFEQAGYFTDESKDTVADDINLTETVSDIGSIDDLVNLILDNKDKGYEGIEGGTEEAEEEEKRIKKSKKSKPADKDYDGDGEVESSEEEHAGVVDNAIKKKKKAEREDSETELEEEPRVDEAPEVAEEPEVEEKPKEKKSKKKEDDSDIMASFKKFEDILDSIDFEGMKEFETPEEDEEEQADDESANDEKEEETE